MFVTNLKAGKKYDTRKLRFMLAGGRRPRGYQENTLSPVGQSSMFSSGCNSDGCGSASAGLTTGIGWKVTELGDNFSASTPNSTKSIGNRGSMQCEQVSKPIGFSRTCRLSFLYFKRHD